MSRRSRSRCTGRAPSLSLARRRASRSARSSRSKARRHDMAQPLRSRAGRRPAAGFTLAEMVVTLAIFSLVILAILAMFDMNGRIARVEGRVTDMQQSLRAGQQDIVRNIRMAARGGLPVALFPDVPSGYAGRQLPTGMAIEVANNVAASTKVANNAEAPVLQG